MHENASIVKKNMYVLEILVRYSGFGPFLCRCVKGYGSVFGVYSVGVFVSDFGWVTVSIRDTFSEGLRFSRR